MADLTKCYGVGCPIKEECFRYTVAPNPDRQAYFTEIPGEMIDNKFTCAMTWTKTHQGIYDRMMNIVKGETKDDN